MKIEMVERQSIAWFKLSEFVARGEKERAMSLLRLLTHSFDDRAYSRKLAAEILACFQDVQALDEYIQAAHLYRLQGDLIEAVSIYELLILLEPETVEYYEKVIIFFQELGNAQKVLSYQKELCTLLIQKGRVDKAIALFETIQSALNSLEQISFLQMIVVAALIHTYPHQAVITGYLKKTLDGLLRFSQEAHLTAFLNKIEMLNKHWYKDALALLNEL